MIELTKVLKNPITWDISTKNQQKRVARVSDHPLLSCLQYQFSYFRLSTYLRSEVLSGSYSSHFW